MQAVAWLFVPAHRERLLARAFDSGADVVVLDLEDGVPEGEKQRAREQAREALRSNTAWVRVAAVGTRACEEDLAAIGGFAAGIRLPKVESPRDVAFVRERLDVAIGCTIETPMGVLTAPEIAASSGVRHVSFGAADLGADLEVGPDSPTLAHARARLVLAARAAGLTDVIDGAFTHTKDDRGLMESCLHARSLGFTGKSAIHPRQVAVIREAFGTSPEERTWAEDVLDAFARAGGPATLPSGEFIDAAVVARARRSLGR